SFIADLYAYVVPYRTRSDVDFFIEAAPSSGGPVLEVGCGTGRVLIPTARSGIDIVGLDLSRHMLRVCQKRLIDDAVSVRFRASVYKSGRPSGDSPPQDCFPGLFQPNQPDRTHLLRYAPRRS